MERSKNVVTGGSGFEEAGLLKVQARNIKERFEKGPDSQDGSQSSEQKRMQLEEEFKRIKGEELSYTLKV
jgi:hypothetical protein